MKRAAAVVAATMAAATIFFAAPAQAKPVCDDPLGICYRLCQWHIVC
jgi:hypothetical protein